MKHLSIYITATVTLVVLGNMSKTYGQSAEPAAQGFSAFKLLRTRNVFDPERRPGRSETSSSRPASLTSRPDYLILTGTMVTDGKALAFFTGSRSDYTKVIPVAGKVADYTVTGIESGKVNLEHSGKEVELGIGKQITLDGTGSITANTAPPDPSVTSPQPGSSSPNPPAAAPAASPGSNVSTSDPSDVLRRMMERRQKEMSK